MDKIYYILADEGKLDFLIVNLPFKANITGIEIAKKKVFFLVWSNLFITFCYNIIYTHNIVIITFKIVLIVF